MCYFKMQNLSPHLKKVRYVFSAVGFHSDTICRQEAFVFIRGTIMQVWKKAFRAPATFQCRFHQYVLPLRITPDSSKSAREPRKKDLKQGPFFSTIYPFSYFTHLLTYFVLNYSILCLARQLQFLFHQKYRFIRIYLQNDFTKPMTTMSHNLFNKIV